MENAHQMNFSFKAFADEFRDTCQIWREYFSQQLVASGQTITKARALIYLAESPKQLTQRELAELLSIEEASVVRMIDGLEKEGLVERKPVYTDKRSKHVMLTAAAIPVIAQIQTIADEVRAQALLGIPDEKLAVACEVFRMISMNVS